jgi:4-amino-4-deoxy-L-arabinose transferase-like glycosyltransferase
MIMEDKKYTQWFWILNFGFLFFRLLYISLPQLAPQEAYYWNYSRHLALSYFDHPPLHAWLIHLSTLMGTAEFTVRLFAPLFAFGTVFFCFLIGRLLFSARVAFWFAVTLNAILIFNIGSVIITPDVPLLLFWSMSFYLFAKLALTNNGESWYPLGVCLGLAMLSKYTAIFIPIAVSLFLLLSREHRFWFVRKEPYIAVLLSVLTFSPVLIWNAQNEWASFAFQTSRRAGELGSLSIRDFLAYLGSQLGVVSPLIYGGIIYVLIRLTLNLAQKKRLFAPLRMTADPSEASSDDTARTKTSPQPLRVNLFSLTNRNEQDEPSPTRGGSCRELLLASWSLPIILFFTLVSFKYWVKINWPTPGYVAAILATVVLFQNRAKAFNLTGLAIGFIFVLLGYASPFLPISLGKGEAIYGWKELALTVEAVRQKMGKDKPIIIGYEYKTASELAFYLPDRPETFSNSLVGEKGLSYDFWSKPDDYVGRDAIFVYDQRVRYKEPEKLLKFFEKVEKEPELEVLKRGKRVTTFHMFRCYNYKGVS